MTEKNTWVFDFDSTLHHQETLDEILALALKRKLDAGEISEEEFQKRKMAIQQIMNDGMDGKIPFDYSLVRRLSEAALTQENIKEFIDTTLKDLEGRIVKIIDYLKENEQEIFIISGGFKSWIDPIAERYGIKKENVFANTFAYNEQQKIIGANFENPLSKSGGKIKIIKQLQETGKLVGQIIMVGDGGSDWEVYEKGYADKFIHFAAYADRKAIREKIDTFLLKNPEQKQNIHRTTTLNTFEELLPKLVEQTPEE